ncbi:Homeobox protein NANOG [Heterocephalus glaber]|uniref:Homeobox protein NANOG n=1 Tax=Heterocephalus glaber TaxID=10181 RepID=G5BPN0_HETGA|nr:Homeobox protein NANOG [Heterocephalus glaber]
MSAAAACAPGLSDSEAADNGKPAPRPPDAHSCPPPPAPVPPADAAASSLPSSMDLLLQEPPDSSTSPCIALPGSQEEVSGKEEGKVPAKKQKVRTVFSQTQLCVLNDRFQRQKYLSLQQMQELSSLLNLSYKQVKTWFQNQRMKCKRWQKSNWPKNSSSIPQKGPAPAEYPGACSNYAQGYLVNTSGNLPVWGNQTWNNAGWSSPSWGSPSWNAQSWCPQAWSAPLPGFGEEALQPCLPFPQNFPASDLEAALEAVGDSYKYLSTPQSLDLFLNYPTNPQPGDL